MSAARLRAACAALACGALASACVEPRASLGDISLRPYQDNLQTLQTFGVQEGRLVSGSVDVAMDPDGCARGEVTAGSMLVLCPQKVDAPPAEEGGKVVRWSGLGGNLATEVSADGKKLRVDGYLTFGRGNRQVHVTLLYGRGREWDELRTHPVLYAVAAAATGMQGEPPEPQ